MADVMISYSRHDAAFVRQLHASLSHDRRDTWIDWEDIPVTADWWQEICAAIEGADTFVFVITPDSVSSPVCNLEIDHARLHNKRLVPIMRRDTDAPSAFAALAARPLDANTQALLNGRDILAVARDNWNVLARHNWLIFKEDADFPGSFKRLLAALDQDLDYVRRHTRLLVRARQWDGAKRAQGFVLRGEELAEMEKWLATSEANTPKPTELQTQYLLASVAQRQRDEAEALARQRRLLQLQQRAANRLRYLAGALVVFLIAALGLSVLALRQQRRAEDNAALARTQEAAALSARATAEREAAEANSLLLANAAQDASERGDTSLATTLALAGVALENPPGAAQRVLANIVYAPARRMTFQWDKDVDNGLIEGVDISPGGQFIVSKGGRKVVLWEVATGARLREYDLGLGEGVLPALVRFSPDGTRLLISLTDGRVLVIEAASGRLVYTLSVPASATAPGLTAISDLDWQGDHIVAVQGPYPFGRATSTVPYVLALWDAETGALLQTLAAPTVTAFRVALSADGQIALTDSAANELVLWQLPTWTEIHRWPAHPAPIIDLAISADGTRLVSADERQALVWSSAGVLQQTLAGHSDIVNVAEMSRDGRYVVTGAWDEVLMLWDAATGTRLRTFPANNIVTAVALSRDGRVAVVGSYQISQANVLMAFDLFPGDLLSRVTVPNLTGVAFSADGSRAAVATNLELRELDLITGEIGQSAVGLRSMRVLAFSPAGQQVAVGGSEGQALLWNLADNSTTALTGIQQVLYSLAFSPAGDRLLLGSVRQLAWWDMGPGAPVKSVPIESLALALAYHPDGSRVVVGDFHGNLTMLQMPALQAVQTWRASNLASVEAVAYSPDGRYVLTGSCGEILTPSTAECGRGEVILWDTVAGGPVRIFAGHTDWVRVVAFSPDGRYALSGSDDQTVIVWEVATGESVRVLRLGAAVLAAQFSADGAVILTAAADGTLSRWRFDTLAQLVVWTYQNRFVRELTCSERLEYRFAPPCDVAGVYPTRTPVAGR